MRIIPAYLAPTYLHFHIELVVLLVHPYRHEPFVKVSCELIILL